MKKYLILYEGCWDSREAFVYEADSLVGLFIGFADYCGDNSEVFEKAISVMETIYEYIEMWNKFSSTRICAIYEVNDAVYG